MNERRKMIELNRVNNFKIGTQTAKNYTESTAKYDFRPFADNKN